MTRKTDALEMVLASYRDMFGKTERGNELHRDACIEVADLITKAEKLEAATAFEVMPQFFEGGKAWGEIAIRRQVQRDNSVKWAVYCRSFVLTKSGEWVFEPIPSSRTDEFIADTRFDSLASAWIEAEIQVTKMRRQAGLLAR
jgi:hypothetical protein